VERLLKNNPCDERRFLILSVMLSSKVLLLKMILDLTNVFLDFSQRNRDLLADITSNKINCSLEGWWQNMLNDFCDLFIAVNNTVIHLNFSLMF
jgi:hypothetical protein